MAFILGQQGTGWTQEFEAQGFGSGAAYFGDGYPRSSRYVEHRQHYVGHADLGDVAPVYLDNASDVRVATSAAITITGAATSRPRSPAASSRADLLPGDQHQRRVREPSDKNGTRLRHQPEQLNQLPVRLATLDAPGAGRDHRPRILHVARWISPLVLRVAWFRA